MEEDVFRWRRTCLGGGGRVEVEEGVVSKWRLACCLLLTTLRHIKDDYRRPPTLSRLGNGTVSVRVHTVET